MEGVDLYVWERNGKFEEKDTVASFYMLQICTGSGGIMFIYGYKNGISR